MIQILKMIRRIKGHVMFFFRKFIQKRKKEKYYKNILILGVGGFGSRMVDFLNLIYPTSELYAIDTKQSDLALLKIKNKVLLGEEILEGLGSGHNPINAKKAVQSSSMYIRQILKPNSQKKLFLITGLGLGTGSGATPEIIRIANEFMINPEVLAISDKSWGNMNDPKGNVKNCLLELENLQCEVFLFDDEFISNNYRELSIRQAFEITCLMIKTHIDNTIENDYAYKETKR